MIKTIAKHKRYYRFIIFAGLMVFLVAGRMSIIHLEARKTVYNIDRLHQEVGLPVTGVDVAKFSETFYQPLTVVRVGNSNIFKAYVGPDDKSTLATGGRVTLKYHDKTYNGRIESIANKIDLDIGLYVVRISIVASDLDVQPFYEVGAESETVNDKIIIDRSLVWQDEDKSYFVWVIENNRAKKRNVVLGLSNQYRVVVKSGLNVGDVVITSDVGPLRDDLLVEREKDGGLND